MLLCAVLQQLSTQTKPWETCSVQSSLHRDSQWRLRLHRCFFAFLIALLILYQLNSICWFICQNTFSDCIFTTEFF